MTIKRWKLIVTGRVQGVCYRISTKSRASELGIFGYTRNLPDGNVEIIAEGNQEQLDELKSWCQKGPPAALVSSVNVEEKAATGEFPGFDVRR